MNRIITNMASEFWFFSQLHRLGYEAYITLGNAKKIDIVVILNNETKLTFDVKGKETFESGDYQYLPEEITKNHYFVFVGLQIKKNNESDKIIFSNEPECYIIHSKDLHEVAEKWESSKGKPGYGFNPKILRYLKTRDGSKISEKVRNRFLERHKIKRIIFNKYSKIIMDLVEFENKFYNYKINKYIL